MIRLQELLRRKCEILARGVRVTQEAWQHLATSDALLPKRMRSGTSGGLHLTLAPGVTVDCPVRERFVSDSPLELRHDDSRYTIAGPEGPWPVETVPRPRWYETSQQLGQVCGDRLTISVSSHCAVFADPKLRCSFCSIGFNRKLEEPRRRDSDLHAMIALALADPAHPVRHVMIGGGTRDLKDLSYGPAITMAQGISATFVELPLSAMMVPPSDSGHLDKLCEAGVGEIAINIELWSPAAAANHTPGKHRLFGRDGYLGALDRAVEVFGPRRVRSLIVVGLEPMAETLRAVEAMAEIGVVPVLSPLRPLQQTALENLTTPSPEYLFELHEASLAICHRHGTCLGPLCAGCQSNTLAIHGLSDIGPASTPQDSIESGYRSESLAQSDDR